MALSYLRIWALSSLAILVTACGGNLTGAAACGSEFRSESDLAPAVTNFELRSQLDGDPWTLIFSATFEDSNGDLGPLGRAKFYLGGELAADLELTDVFRQSGLEQDAIAGELALPLRFSETVQDGAQVTLGLQLLDGNSFRSNCYSLGLEFNVEDVN